MHLSPMMFNSSPEDVCMVSKLIFGISFFNFAIIHFLFSLKLAFIFSLFPGDEVPVQLAHLPPHSQHLPPTSPSQVTLALDLHPRNVFLFNSIFFTPSVLSVSAAHQFAVNRWNPQYSGLASSSSAGGASGTSSSSMSSSTPSANAGMPYVCILRTTTTTTTFGSIWTHFCLSKSLIKVLLDKHIEISIFELSRYSLKYSCLNIKVL